MRLINLLIAVFILSLASLAYANIGGLMQVQGKGITLYAEPSANAKAVANVAAGQQLIPVFQQGDWLKVANPANGMVGWAKQADLQQATPNASHQTVMQNYIITQQGNDKKVFQIDANGDVHALKGEQAQTVIKQMGNQQKQMQDQMNKMMSNAWQNFLMTQEFFKKFNQQMDAQMATMMPSAVIINKDNTANKTPAAATINQAKK